MAQIPNIGGLTIAAEEVRDLREAIARAVYQSPDFLKFHNVVDGITKKTQILLDDTSGRAGWKATGCAVIQSEGMSIKLAQLYWETVTIEDMLDYCQADLDVNFKPLVLRNSKDKFGDLEDQEAIKTFVYASVVRFIAEAVERLAWLGDKDADNVTNDGYVKDTIDKRFYTPLDGIWKQVMTAVTAGTTPHTNVTRNEQATKVAQLALSDAEAFAMIKGVYDNADDALKLDPNAYIRVTAAVYNGYKNYLAAETLKGGGLSEKTVNGIPVVAYMGVPVYTSLFESKVLLADFEVSDGGSPAVMTYNFPHRAIMATPDLLPAATINTDDIGNIESEYVWKDRKSYVRFNFDIDVKVVRPDMISVAY